MTKAKKGLKEAREGQASIIANMVFRIQGSDKKYVQDKEGIKYAGMTLQEIIDDALQQQREEIAKKLWKCKIELTKDPLTGYIMSVIPWQAVRKVLDNSPKIK